MEKEDLNKTFQTEEELIEDSKNLELPDEALFASAKRAKSMVWTIHEFFCGKDKFSKEASSKVCKIASEIVQEVEDLNLSEELLKSIPDLEISEDVNQTADSFEAYANGCEEACRKIGSIRTAAGNKFLALSKAVKQAKNPSAKKIQARVSEILAGVSSSVWAAESYNPAEQKKEIIQNLKDTTKTNIQNRKLNSVIDWEFLKSRNPRLYALKSVLSRLTYGDVVELFQTIKNSSFVKRQESKLED